MHVAAVVKVYNALGKAVNDIAGNVEVIPVRCGASNEISFISPTIQRLQVFSPT
jgi:hypothetical protein